MISLQLILYSLLFIVTSAMVAVGIMISYQLLEKGSRHEFQWLFYQQLLWDAFLIFGIWGYFTLNHLLKDIGIDTDIKNRILIFQPYVGLPFLLVSWYMLVRFFLALHAFQIPRWMSYAWFIGCLLLLPTGVFLINGLSGTGNFHRQFFSMLSVINLSIICAVYLLYILKRSNEILGKWSRYGFMHGFAFATLVSTSIILFMADNHPYIFLLVIVTLFLSGLLLVLHFHTETRKVTSQTLPTSSGFEAFCQKFEITRREAEIIMEISKGKTNRQIAEDLFITVQTVKDHIYRIYTKTGVNNRVQLLNIASIDKK